MESNTKIALLAKRTERICERVREKWHRVTMAESEISDAIQLTTIEPLSATICQ